MMADLIDRQAAKDVIHKRLGTMDLFESRFNADIDQIPSIDPESLRPQGEWIDYAEGGKQCTACYRVFWHGEYNPIKPDYCLYCGGYMKGGKMNETYL